MKLGGELLNQNIGGTSNNIVIYINKNVDDMSFVFINKQRRVTLAKRDEREGKREKQGVGEREIPSKLRKEWVRLT